MIYLFIIINPCSYLFTGVLKGFEEQAVYIAYPVLLMCIVVF